MKQVKNLFAVAAALVVAAVITGCSSDLGLESLNILKPEAPVVTYKVSIPADKSGDNLTRALAEDGFALNATWGTGEKVYAYKGDTKVGELTPATTGTASTTLVGELSVSGGFAVNDEVTLYYLKDKSYHGTYSGQIGTLANISANFDYATATVNVTKVGLSSDFTNGDNILETGSAAFAHNQAINKFRFVLNNQPAEVSSLKITAEDLTGSPLVITPTTATSVLYVALNNKKANVNPIPEATYRFDVTIGSVIYTVFKSVALSHDKFYIVNIPLRNTYSNLAVTIPSKVYTGSALTPEVTVKIGETTLTKDTDYEIIVTGDCIDAGYYPVTINGKGSYSFTYDGEFEIKRATNNEISFTTASPVVLTVGGTTATCQAQATFGTPTYTSSNPDVATVTAGGVISPLTTGTTVISASVVNNKNYEGCSTTSGITVYVKQAGIASSIGLNAPDDVEAVDLGLSVKWANMNLGATKSSDLGLYFSWGDTYGSRWNYFDEGTDYEANYVWYTKVKVWDSSLGSWINRLRLSKYCPTQYQSDWWWDPDGTTTPADNKTNLDLADDAARANWGGTWRMPTKAELEALLNLPKEHITINGVEGYRFTGNGNSIFIPDGIYWSSELDLSSSWAPIVAYSLKAETNISVGRGDRFSVLLIRAVQ